MVPFARNSTHIIPQKGIQNTAQNRFVRPAKLPVGLKRQKNLSFFSSDGRGDKGGMAPRAQSYAINIQWHVQSTAHSMLQKMHVEYPGVIYRLKRNPMKRKLFR